MGTTKELLMEYHYEKICKDRFTELHQNIAELKHDEILPLREDVTYLKAKIDNGLSSLPARVNWLLGIVFALLLGVIGLAYTSGQNQAEMMTKIEMHMEADK